MWQALTGLSILVLGTLVVFIVWLTSSVLGYLQPVLVPLAMAGIIAYLLDPVVKFLQKKGVSRLQGIAAVFCGFMLFFGGLFFFIGDKLNQQINDVLGSTRNSETSMFSPAKLEEYRDGSFGWAFNWFYTKDFSATQKHLLEGGTLIGTKDKQGNKIKYHLDSDGKTLVSVSDAPISKDLNKLFRSDWTLPMNVDGVENAHNLIALENYRLTRGGSMITNWASDGLGWLSNSSGKILGFLGIIIGFAMVPIYLFYFLKESDAIQAGWQDYVPLKASQFKTEVIETLREINGYLISFFRGQVLVAFIDGILVGLTLTLFKLEYGLLIGVVMALLGIIPYIGNILCLIPACIIAAVQKPESLWGLPQWGSVLAVVAIFIVVQQINSLVTAPKIVGDSVGLHPMTVIFSMLFWSLLLGGFLGALLAVPLTAAVKVLFRRYIWEKQELEKDASPA